MRQPRNPSLQSLALALLLSSGCVHADPLDDCDGSYASVQTHVFSSACAGSGCHSASSAAGNLDLESLGAEHRLLTSTSSLCHDAPLVVPGAPDDSYLWEKVASSAPSCGDVMPPARALTAIEKACIRRWINAVPPVANLCETCGGGACIDLANDAENCGACEQACASGMQCQGGSCVQACPVNTIACNGECSNTASDPLNCGDCGLACAAGDDCVNGQCLCTPAVEASFALDIEPLLQTNCTGSCHAGASPSAGLDLSMGIAYPSLLNVPSSQCPERMLVAPGQPHASYLFHKLEGANLCAGSIMPPGGSPWPPAQLEAVAGWICAGAPQN